MSWEDILKEEPTGFLELDIESKIKKIVLDLPKDRLAEIRNGRINDDALITYIQLESFKRWARSGSRTPLKINDIKVDPSLNKPGKETTINIEYSVKKGIYDDSLLIRRKEFSFTLDDEYKKRRD
tara:strand:- start:391 stop:765 length:375 start_codon:yes stop_codon:yes gene_type:complete